MEGDFPHWFPTIFDQGRCGGEDWWLCMYQKGDNGVGPGTKDTLAVWSYDIKMDKHWDLTSRGNDWLVVWIILYFYIYWE